MSRHQEQDRGLFARIAVIFAASRGTYGSPRVHRALRQRGQRVSRRRRPTVGLIFHSDRGSEYLGTAFRHRLAAHGVRQSMTRGGAPGENPHIESFFHSFKAEVVHGCRFQTIGELRRQLRWYWRFYNHQRLHSALGYQSPVDYERRAA